MQPPEQDGRRKIRETGRRGYPFLTYDQVIQKFWSLVIKPDNEEECWGWSGSLLVTTGYPQFYAGTLPDGTRVRTTGHRFCMEIFLGRKIASEEFVLHRCDNRSCCNPKHLFLGTQHDNMLDMHSKGRGAKGEKVGTSVLTEEQVRSIRTECVPYKTSYRKLADKYGVGVDAIRRIILGKSWKHVE